MTRRGSGAAAIGRSRTDRRRRTTLTSRPLDEGLDAGDRGWWGLVTGWPHVTSLGMAVASVRVAVTGGRDQPGPRGRLDSKLLWWGDD